MDLKQQKQYILDNWKTSSGKTLALLLKHYFKNKFASNGKDKTGARPTGNLDPYEAAKEIFAPEETGLQMVENPTQTT